jgi:hypothetical protein
MTLEQAIEIVKQHAEQSKDNLYIICVDFNRYLVKLHKDGDKFLPTCQYKRMILYDKGYAPEFLWTITDTVQFVQTFITYSKPVLSVLQKRKYGEPKLTKPKELKGLKGASIDFIPKKCKFQYYTAEDDLYILCRDFFSPTFYPPVEDRGLSLSVLYKKYFGVDKHCKNFVYPDTWGSIVLRNEAWLKMENYKIIDKQSKNQFERRKEFKNVFVNGLLKAGYVVREDDTYWQHFIERLSDEVCG